MGSSAGMRWWAAALLAGCLLVAAGCDGDADETAPTPETEAPTTEDSTEPTTAAGPVEPTLPPEAEGSSPQAAKAFVRYYTELLNYAMVTGDTAAFGIAGTAGCAGCTDYIEAIRGIYNKGGSYRTQGWKLSRVVLSGQPQGGYLLSVVARSSRVSYTRHSSARPEHIQPQRFTFSLEVIEKGGAWHVSGFFPD